jgi:hypothetical protein
MPPQTERTTALEMTCLKEWRDARLSHDHLFHTVAGLLGICATEYRAPLYAFELWRRP